MRHAVREAVAELDAQGITEPSTGWWSTPIVLVRKASGAWRLCCDYRAINKHVRIPQQPLPRTDGILASFKGKKYFSVLDMCKGFYQIDFAEEDRPKTSFVTPDCQRQYRRLPSRSASQILKMTGRLPRRWGLPRALLSDNSPQFTAEPFTQLCTTFGISKLFAFPCNPRGNSTVGSYMRSLETTLRLCLQPFRSGLGYRPARRRLSLQVHPSLLHPLQPLLSNHGSRAGPPLAPPMDRASLAPLWCALASRRLALPSRCPTLSAARRGRQTQLFLKDPHRLELGMHVALRIPAKKREAQGKFSPAFRGSFVNRTSRDQSDAYATHDVAQKVTPPKMQSPPQSRFRREREDVVEVEEPPSVASHQTVQQHVQQPTPTPVPHQATPSSPVARLRPEQAEPRVIRFVVEKFRPSDLKDIKNAKKTLAKPQTQEGLQHKEIIYV
ncbi:hypothetical protein Emag_007722 [Eimeria magna]